MVSDFVGFMCARVRLMLFPFLKILFLFLNLPVCFLRKNEVTELDGWEVRDLGADKEGKTITRIDYMKNLFKHYEKLVSFY